MTNFTPLATAFTAIAVAAAGLAWFYQTREEPPAVLVYTDQGERWTNDLRQDYYTTDQGSRMVPLRWLRALQQADGQPFLMDSFRRYGYLANPSSPDGLPVGFTIAGPAGSESVGMTCAACHTRDIEVSGKRYRIDGGPALADFQSFVADLDVAAAAVLANEASFAAFAEQVLGQADTDAVTKLRADVKAWYHRFNLMTKSMLPGQTWGPGRLDAISMIFNRLTGLDIGPAPDFIIEENIHKADAPTRYPFLWNAGKQAKTQWLGFAPNHSDFHADVRNIGQVLGVFGEFRPVRFGSQIDAWSNSSVDLPGLQKLETLGNFIEPPRWPWSIDNALADRGAEIYEKTCTEGCHGIKPAAVNPDYWDTPTVNVGTDTRQLMLLGRMAKPGILAGPAIAPGLPPLRPEGERALTILAVTAGYTRATAPGAAPPAPAASPSLVSEAMEVQADTAKAAAEPSAQPLPGYEARVLKGVWAAAPYLHNGSIPTLKEILKPAAQRVRSRSFKVGPAYDVDEVGLAEQQPASAATLTTTGCDDLNSGNSHCGHEYGTALSDDDKRALLEYLKRL